MAVLELKNVNLSFQGSSVLEDINVAIEEKDFVGLIGPNGAGKTALLKLILGLYSPDTGSISIKGKSPAQARGLIGYVPQYAHFDRNFPISVLDVVLMGRLAKKKIFARYNANDVAVARNALSQVSLSGFEKRQLGKLSGGELQRVFIARALATEADIFMMDEPTASLDTSVGQSVFELLRELNKEKTIILVSHDLGVISTYVKSVACLNKKLHFHPASELTGKLLQEVYGCPIDLIAHGHSHRVLPKHDGGCDSC